ncbi:MAG: tetratricopeptide repeat protein [Actinomycetota bacterium]|nr:tetratricopeptide repeat protein [Actinomycetota bacterium]
MTVPEPIDGGEGLAGLGLWVREWRHANRWTQEDLAEALGYDVSYVAKIERGRRRPTPQFVARVAEVTATPKQEVLTLARRPSARTRLPMPTTPLLGRAREVDEVTRLLEPPGRCVTLVGAPGIGKTSLALEVAWQMAESLRHGACFVPLGEVSDPASVSDAIIHQLGVAEQGSSDLDSLLVKILRHRNILLVLDNFEHVLGARHLIEGLVRRASCVRVLVTSREALGLEVETEYELATLPVPRPGDCLDAAEDYAAVQMFVSKSRLARPTFVLDESNVASVVEICSRLDGLPLAISLTASASRILSPADIAKSLRVRLELPTAAGSDPLARPRLCEALDWSWELLEPSHRRLLARLGVFVGGCSLAAAEAVCSKGDDDVLAGLAALESKSLIGATSSDEGDSRFTCLETVRRYALNKLSAEGQLGQMRDRHCSYFVAMASVGESKMLGGHDQASWLRNLESEHANLTAAFDWALARHPEKALRLAAALWRFYSMGRISEGRRLIAQSLSSTAGLPTDYIAALTGLGVLARAQGDLKVAGASFARARGLAIEGGYAPERALAVLNEGIVAEAQGAYDEAEAHFSEAAARYRATGDSRGFAHALNCLGVIALRRDDKGTATSSFLSALSRFRALNDRCSVAVTATNLGWMAETDGELGEARQWYEETLQIWEDVGDEHGRARAMASLGRLARHGREFARARTLLEQALRALHRLGDRRLAAACLLELADIAIERKHRDLAGRLVGAAEGVREALGTPAWPDEAELQQRILGELYETVGPVSATRAISMGKALSLEDAVEMVQSDVWPPVVRRRAGRRPGPARTTWHSPGPLASGARASTVP